VNKYYYWTKNPQRKYKSAISIKWTPTISSNLYTKILKIQKIFEFSSFIISIRLILKFNYLLFENPKLDCLTIKKNWYLNLIFCGFDT
jgi:hypothetical protein